ncbi:hypothetical protein HGM15179_018647, partial [Zosterops borbonicus]
MKGKSFKVPVIKDAETESKTKICLGDMLLVEEPDYNLLGRDLIVALRINLIVKESQLVVSLYKLTTEDEEVIELQTKIRPDLEEEELEEGEKWLADGSTRVVEGKRKSIYAIVDVKMKKTHIYRVKKIERLKKTSEWEVNSSPENRKIKYHWRTKMTEENT